MELKKKVQCTKCLSIVEQNGTCVCGKIVMVEGHIMNASIGFDYRDISPKLLNEVV
jgi:hypothetical protein